MKLTSVDPKQQAVTSSFAKLYNPTLTVDNFVKQGLLVKDQNGHSVGVAVGELRSGMVHTGQPYADIMVIGVQKGVLLGWTYSDKMIDAGDRFLIPVKALNGLPKTLKFAQKCPHLSVYGGWFNAEERNWECFGCGQSIVFSGSSA